jgi:hypothetical protein
MIGGVPLPDGTMSVDMELTPPSSQGERLFQQRSPHYVPKKSYTSEIIYLGLLLVYPQNNILGREYDSGGT